MSEHIVFIEASLTGSGEKTCQYARRTERQVTLVCKEPTKYHKDITDYVDNIVVADTNDTTAIINELEVLNSKYKIHGITTTNDFYVIQTAEVAEHFGLPTTPSAKVATMKNKYLMRKALAATHPHLNPKFALAMTYDEAKKFISQNWFPFIAKPQDANDSVHVKIISKPSDLKMYFEERETWGRNIVGQSFAKGVLLEDLMDGPEYCLDVLKPFNKPMICVGAFTKKISGEKTGNFIKIGASFPTPDRETHQLFNQISPALDALGIAVGAANIDCKIVNGQVKILEINPRLVGDQMGSHMIELATGHNPAHAVVEMALGKDIDWQNDIQRSVAIHRITMARAGYFYGLGNAEEMAADNNVVFVNELGTKGQWYDPAKSNQDVIGSVIAIGTTPEEAMETASHWALGAEIVNHVTNLHKVEPDRKLFNPTARGISLLKL